jgi:signal transduction histidine kinase
MSFKPRILIVEDQPESSEDFIATFSAPDAYLVTETGVAGFSVDHAITKRKAEDFLTHALRDMRPYDAMLLDLGLPPIELEKDVDVKFGFELLAEVQTKFRRACPVAVINSIHSHANDVIHVLRSGGADFVAKPCTGADLYPHVVNAYKKARARLEIQWRGIQQRHVHQWLLVQARARSADDMARIITDGMNRLHGSVRDLERLLRDHYHLNTQAESDHPIGLKLRELDEGIRRTTARCVEARGSMQPHAGEWSRWPLARAVNDAVETLWPGFALRRIALDRPTGDVAVHTFPAEAGMILEEVASNAIEASEEGSTLGCEIGVERTPDRRERAFIRISDRAPRLAAEHCEAINRGRPLEQDAGRAWGLSLAQWLAENIGARLEVEPGPHGNVFTLKIPVTADDELAGR